MKRQLLLSVLFSLTFVSTTSFPMLIWGYRSIKTYEGNILFKCIICQNDNVNVYSMRRYFTLFFIPVFSMGDKKFYLECVECENSYTLKKEIDIEELLSQAKLASP